MDGGQYGDGCLGLHLAVLHHVVELWLRFAEHTNL